MQPPNIISSCMQRRRTNIDLTTTHRAGTMTLHPRWFVVHSTMSISAGIYADSLFVQRCQSALVSTLIRCSFNDVNKRWYKYVLSTLIHCSFNDVNQRWYLRWFAVHSTMPTSAGTTTLHQRRFVVLLTMSINTGTTTLHLRWFVVHSTISIGAGIYVDSLFIQQCQPALVQRRCINVDSSFF